MTHVKSKLNIVRIVLIAMLVPGCALVGPDYQRPEIEIPADYSEPNISPEVNAILSPAWWELYE